MTTVGEVFSFLEVTNTLSAPGRLSYHFQNLSLIQEKQVKKVLPFTLKKMSMDVTKKPRDIIRFKSRIQEIHNNLRPDSNTRVIIRWTQNS